MELPPAMEEILTLTKLEERVKWDAYYILAKASQEEKIC